MLQYNIIVTVLYLCSDSQLLTTGKWSNRITVQQANNGHVLQFHYISLEYGNIIIYYI